MPDGSEVLVILDKVSKSFNGNQVLKDISTTVRTGEVLGLIGRSGSGKSVLINVMRGSHDYKPDSGRVIYRVNHCPSCGWLDLPSPGAKCTKCGKETKVTEIDFWAMDERDPLRLAMRGRIAIMLQRTFALYGDLTVIENVFEVIKGMSDEKKVERAIQLLEMVNMTYRTMHIARDLSGGEKQRTVLARQLARDPLLFLADEPTGTLDPETADIVHKALIKAVKDTGMSMVITSHWPKAINLLSHRAIWLEDGMIKAEGDPREITKAFDVSFVRDKEMEVQTGEPVIRVKNAKKYFYSIVRGVVKAVDDVSFEVAEKEIFGLIGQSGAGKTTLSRMISGITPATHGEVLVRIGDDWINMSDLGEEGRGRATQYIGIMHQENALYPFNTVLQNLTICLGMKLPQELAKMKAIQVLRGVGFTAKEVDHILYAYPDSLSVGEKQRIALARTLIMEPRFVVLDEPTGTMDPITRQAVAKSVLHSRKELNQTYLIVSHDMDFVLACCDRVALMKSGKIVAIGPPQEVLRGMTQDELEGEESEVCEV
ncbi:MAG TPA: methyl coenzyme M reductase system, component A2 [Methanomassiliicoccales archaeon]|jgi:methyl coenzyme M reductase system subunit A2|nr:methyl coenzyme M reductase system, component A2 [Methanomassiliicoccales archaeon]